MRKHAAWFTALFLLLAVPTVVIGGALLFRERAYAFLALAVAALSLVPLLYTFERRDNTSKELTVLAVLIALSVAGRFLFAWLPGFKPITAITVIVAVHLGKEAGFAVGSLSAVISNFYFGQGPWTPFQMFAWGLLGFLAGCLAAPLKKSRFLLCLYGAAAGVMYSLTMDVFTVLWAEGGFSLPRYLAAVIAALPVTAAYAVSNVIFLVLLAAPIGDKLRRIQTKYGLFAPSVKP